MPIHPQKPNPGAPSLDSDPAAILLREIEALQQQLDELEKDAAWSHRLAMLGVLTGAVAHEINNLLTPVLSYSEMALTAPDDPAIAHKALRKAFAGADQAARATRAILGFLTDREERPDASVQECAGSALECLVRGPERDAIDIDLDIPDDLRVIIQPIALQQVLLNLLLNAVAALRKRGGGRIEISATRSTGNTDAPTVEIRITDNAGGLPESVRCQIARPLSTATMPSADQSSGLGLTICKRLVEQAQGRCEFEVEPGVGTTARLSLREAPRDHAGMEHSEPALTRSVAG